MVVVRWGKRVEGAEPYVVGGLRQVTKPNEGAVGQSGRFSEVREGAMVTSAFTSNTSIVPSTFPCGQNSRQQTSNPALNNSKRQMLLKASSSPTGSFIHTSRVIVPQARELHPEDARPNVKTAPLHEESDSYICPDIAGLP